MALFKDPIKITSKFDNSNADIIMVRVDIKELPCVIEPKYGVVTILLTENKEFREIKSSTKLNRPFLGIRNSALNQVFFIKECAVEIKFGTPKSLLMQNSEYKEVSNIVKIHGSCNVKIDATNLSGFIKAFGSLESVTKEMLGETFNNIFRKYVKDNLEYIIKYRSSKDVIKEGLSKHMKSRGLDIEDDTFDIDVYVEPSTVDNIRRKTVEAIEEEKSKIEVKKIQHQYEDERQQKRDAYQDERQQKRDAYQDERQQKRDEYNRQEKEKDFRLELMRKKAELEFEVSILEHKKLIAQYQDERDSKELQKEIEKKRAMLELYGDRNWLRQALDEYLKIALNNPAAFGNNGSVGEGPYSSSGYGEASAATIFREVMARLFPNTDSSSTNSTEGY